MDSKNKWILFSEMVVSHAITYLPLIQGKQSEGSRKYELLSKPWQQN